MVNVENPDYQYCLDNKYLIRDSRGIVRPIEWWHGKGGLLDYSNPNAVTWWHQQMDKVLDVGIDGFKCDGTDPYILEYSLTGGALGYNDVKINYTDYAHMYYRDFLSYTRLKRSIAPNTDAGLIMSRPVDCLIDGPSKGCWGYSPRDVMYSGWVGDDDSTFNGLRGCLRKVIYSAWLNYANYGCDIGGYRGNSNSLNKELFIRWFQLSAFLPLMENGGGGEHRPWMYDDETVKLYRQYVTEHHRLAPYFHTIGAYAIEKQLSSMQPIALHESDLADAPDHAIPFPQPSTYSYLYNNELLIHPVVMELENSSLAIVEMKFPALENGLRWLDWWEAWNTEKSYLGDQQVTKLISLASYPVYILQNSFLALQNNEKTNDILFTWFGPLSGEVTTQMRESSSDASGNGLIAIIALDSTSSRLEATISAHDQYSAGIVVIGVSKPSDVSYEPSSSLCVHVYEEQRLTLRVTCQNIIRGVQITATDIKTML
jgi:alpha-glucosidase (family GH31 glycosyl hydrolase)